MKSNTLEFDIPTFKKAIEEKPSKENGWSLEKEVTKKENPSKTHFNLSLKYFNREYSKSI